MVMRDGNLLLQKHIVEKRWKATLGQDKDRAQTKL